MAGRQASRKTSRLANECTYAAARNCCTARHTKFRLSKHNSNYRQEGTQTLRRPYRETCKHTKPQVTASQHSAHTAAHALSVIQAHRQSGSQPENFKSAHVDTPPTPWALDSLTLHARKPGSSSNTQPGCPAVGPCMVEHEGKQTVSCTYAVVPYGVC